MNEPNDRDQPEEPADHPARPGEAQAPGERGRGAAGPPPPAAPVSLRVLDRFTERARRVMVLAQEEAQRFNHNYIGTEHLLLGLVREGEGIAAGVLQSLGVELNKVRSAVEFIVGRGDRGGRWAGGAPAVAPRVKQVLELAVTQARRLGQGYIGTEHLLLGLVIEGEGIAAGVLQSLGVEPEKVRAATLTAIASPGARTAEPAPAARNNVLTCRVDDADLAAIDTLIEAGVHPTRSEAASRLIHAGILANRALFEQVASTVAEIRRLREQAQRLARQAMDEAPPAGGAAAGEASPEGEGGTGPDRPDEPAAGGPAQA